MFFNYLNEDYGLGVHPFTLNILKFNILCDTIVLHFT